MLDKLLVDCAVEEGAELRENITVKDLLRDGDRVVGTVGHDDEHRSFEARSAIVIGADGRDSTIAGVVDAEKYDVRQSRCSGYYSYFSGWPGTGVDLAFNDGNFCGVFPTNGGLICLVTGKPDEEFSSFKADIDASLLAVLDVANPRLGDWARQSKREDRFYAFRAQSSFFRKPYGEGWALVGDAGYYKDPVTGHGITDAFRDAELLENALCDGLRGARPMVDALASYRARRDEMSKDVYHATQDIADLQWDANGLVAIYMRFGVAAEKERVQIAAF